MMTASRPQQHHFLGVHPGSFVHDHSLHISSQNANLSQDSQDAQSRKDQIDEQAREIRRLQGTVAHFRSWASQLQSRYQMFSPDAARPSKRVYLGNLPPDVTEADIRQAINDLMIQSNGTSSPGAPVTSCKLYPDKSYAFVEFRTVEEASNCMAFDGVRYKDTFLKVRRPNNYDPGVAIMLGPTEPNPAMDLSALEIVRTVVHDSPHKIFIGGLPCDWNEEQVTEMLVPFGTLKAFNLVMDRATGNSKGYAFCEFIDIAVTDSVIHSLNGKPVGNKFLTVKRALGPPSF